ncbi:MAG: hypothetical protein HZB31_04220 [Nitrospirae bacterium]|nr:hypothetical protein [Nitrospirota bacterium]
MKRFSHLFCLSVFYLMLCADTNSHAAVSNELGKKLNTIQVPFIVNKGQTANQVKFYAKTFYGTAYITVKGEIVYDFPKVEEKSLTERWSLKEEFIDAVIKSVNGEEEAIAKVSYFTGKNREKWKGNIPTYGLVTIGNVYKGIDCKLRAYGKNVEKLFYIKPGAEPSEIRLKVSGARSLKKNNRGDLEAETGLGTITFMKPVAYQVSENRIETVDVAYAVDNGSYGFTIGEYDKSRVLVIDPLLQATYLGGNVSDIATSMSVTDSGIYVAGYTNSANFPGIDYADQQVNHSGNTDAFVALLSPDLKTLVQVAYIGGSSTDYANSIALSRSGVYVAGGTQSTDFAGTEQGAQQTLSGEFDGFAALLSHDLTTLAGATYFGGSSDEFANVTAVSGSNVYIAGYTLSTNFAGTEHGAQQIHGGDYDGFVVRLNSDLRILIQATYIGGSGRDFINAMTVYHSTVYITGHTTSPILQKTARGAQQTHGGFFDGFVASLNSDLKTLNQTTYLGGSSDDVATAIAVSGSNVYVAGYTHSTNFPGTKHGAQQTYGGNNDGFVALLNSDLKKLIRATYIGGSNYEEAKAVAISGSNVYVAGYTLSSDFPGIAHGAQHTHGGDHDGFVALLKSDLRKLIQATYIGGNSYEETKALGVSGSGIYVAGYTLSTDFPETTQGAQQEHGGDYDVFVGILSSDLGEVRTSRSRLQHQRQ